MGLEGARDPSIPTIVMPPAIAEGRRGRQPPGRCRAHYTQRIYTYLNFFSARLSCSVAVSQGAGGRAGGLW